MRLLLDTHFVIWVVAGSPRLERFGWLERYRPWGLSPVSLLEIQCLSEVGRIDVRNPEFTERLLEDPRFLLDEVSLAGLVLYALPLTWTRDPFDRLLAAHSTARRVPLCTLDRTLRARHAWLAPELG